MKRELRELIVLIFEGYLVRKNEHRLYDRDSAIPEQIISMYYQANEEPPFKILYNNFKRKCYIMKVELTKPFLMKN